MLPNDTNVGIPRLKRSQLIRENISGNKCLVKDFVFWDALFSHVENNHHPPSRASIKNWQARAAATRTLSNSNPANSLLVSMWGQIKVSRLSYPPL